MTQENEKFTTHTEDIVAQLETYLESTWEIPNVIGFVSPKKIRNYFELVKESVVADLEASQKIISERDAIIAQAKRESEEILANARRQVESQDLVKQAKNYAKHLVQEAQKEARSLLDEGQQVQEQLITNSHKYVGHLFDEVDQLLNEKRELLSRNREELDSSLEARMNRINKA